MLGVFCVYQKHWVRLNSGSMQNCHSIFFFFHILYSPTPPHRSLPCASSWMQPEAESPLVAGWRGWRWWTESAGTLDLVVVFCHGVCLFYFSVYLFYLSEQAISRAPEDTLIFILDFFGHLLCIFFAMCLNHVLHRMVFLLTIRPKFYIAGILSGRIELFLF